MKGSAEGGASGPSHDGHVARCSATDCTFNRNQVCRAPGGVQIVFHRDHADCATYSRATRPHR